jgi:hypothetical protein
MQIFKHGSYYCAITLWLVVYYNAWAERLTIIMLSMGDRILGGQLT